MYENSQPNLANNLPTCQINTPLEINKAITLFTSNIHEAIKKCSTIINYKYPNYKLSPEISHKIANKNQLKRESQRFQDPTTK